jgi:hypothetical protein
MLPIGVGESPIAGSPVSQLRWGDHAQAAVFFNMKSVHRAKPSNATPITNIVS